MSNGRIVCIVDDDEAVRDSLSFLLETSGWANRVWASAEAFLADRNSVDAACVLTDVRMPGISGLDLVRKLKADGFDRPVIVMTGHGDIPLAVDAMKAGVADFLEKPIDDDLLLRALETATAQVHHPAADARPEVAEYRARFDALSPRERDVLVGVVAGKPNKVIAHDLGISPRTVEVYRAGLMSKSGAGSLSELVRMSIMAGIETS